MNAASFAGWLGVGIPNLETEVYILFDKFNNRSQFFDTNEKILIDAKLLYNYVVFIPYSLTDLSRNGKISLYF